MVSALPSKILVIEMFMTQVEIENSLESIGQFILLTVTKNKLFSIRTSPKPIFTCFSFSRGRTNQLELLGGKIQQMF